MADTPLPRQSFETRPAPATRRERWRLKRPARLAAILLLLVWVGPVSLVETDTWALLHLVGAPRSASAESETIPAGKAVLLEPGTAIKLRMRDGAVIQGKC